MCEFPPVCSWLNRFLLTQSELFLTNTYQLAVDWIWAIFIIRNICSSLRRGQSSLTHPHLKQHLLNLFVSPQSCSRIILGRLKPFSGAKGKESEFTYQWVFVAWSSRLAWHWVFSSVLLVKTGSYSLRSNHAIRGSAKLSQQTSAALHVISMFMTLPISSQSISSHEVPLKSTALTSSFWSTFIYPDNNVSGHRQQGTPQ